MERLGPAATDPALGSKMAVGAIGELPFESVEFGGERGIAEDAGFGLRFGHYLLWRYFALNDCIQPIRRTNVE